jgi:hypothetical protein
VDLREANIDPGRLLDFHNVMLASAQDDERVRQAWERTNAADVKRRRAALREAWIAHHDHMRELHSGLAAEHATKVAALLKGAGP